MLLCVLLCFWETYLKGCWNHLIFKSQSVFCPWYVQIFFCQKAAQKRVVRDGLCLKNNLVQYILQCSVQFLKLFPHHCCPQGQHTASLCVHSDVKAWYIHYPEGTFHVCLKVSSPMKLKPLSHCKEASTGLDDLPEEGCWSEWDPLSLSEIRPPCLFTSHFILVKLWTIRSCLEDKLNCASLVSSSPLSPCPSCNNILKSQSLKWL